MAIGGLLVKVDAVRIERLLSLAHRLAAGGILVGAMNGARIGFAGHLGDAVGDVVDGVEARHVVDLEVIDGVGFTLGKEGHQDVGAGHFLAARGLNVDGGALHHPLEPGRRLGVGLLGRQDVWNLFVDELGQVLAQLVQVDATGAQHRHRVGILGESQQQMLQRRVLVATLGGDRQGAMQGLLKVARQHGPIRLRPSQWCTVGGAGVGAQGPSLD